MVNVCGEAICTSSVSPQPYPNRVSCACNSVQYAPRLQCASCKRGTEPRWPWLLRLNGRIEVGHPGSVQAVRYPCSQVNASHRPCKQTNTTPHHTHAQREGGRERERGKERGREGGREGKRERERERGGRECLNWGSKGTGLSLHVVWLRGGHRPPTPLLLHVNAIPKFLDMHHAYLHGRNETHTHTHTHANDLCRGPWRRELQRSLSLSNHQRELLKYNRRPLLWRRV